MKFQPFLLCVVLACVMFISALFTPDHDTQGTYLMVGYLMIGISVIVLKLEQIHETLQEGRAEQQAPSTNDIAAK